MDNINQVAAILKYVGKATALAATILICWSFVINPKLGNIINSLGSQQQLLQKKIQITRIAFILMFVDPILLAFNRLPDIALFIKFFGFKPTTSMYGIGHNLGLILILLIVVCTLVLKAKWTIQLIKNIIRAFFGLIPFLLFAHILFVKGDISRYLPLQIWIFSWIIIAIIAFVSATINELKKD